MAVLSLSEMPELKRIVAEYGYEIHLCDACGGQSFELKLTKDSRNDAVYEAIEQFFKERLMTVNYYGDDKLAFSIR